MFIFFASILTFKHWEEQRSKDICILFFYWKHYLLKISTIQLTTIEQQIL